LPRRTHHRVGPFCLLPAADSCQPPPRLRRYRALLVLPHRFAVVWFVLDYICRFRSPLAASFCLCTWFCRFCWCLPAVLPLSPVGFHRLGPVRLFCAFWFRCRSWVCVAYRCRYRFCTCTCRLPAGCCWVLLRAALLPFCLLRFSYALADCLHLPLVPAWFASWILPPGTPRGLRSWITSKSSCSCLPSATCVTAPFSCCLLDLVAVRRSADWIAVLPALSSCAVLFCHCLLRFLPHPYLAPPPAGLRAVLCLRFLDLAASTPACGFCLRLRCALARLAHMDYSRNHLRMDNVLGFLRCLLLPAASRLSPAALCGLNAYRFAAVALPLAPAAACASMLRALSCRWVHWFPVSYLVAPLCCLPLKRGFCSAT